MMMLAVGPFLAFLFVAVLPRGLGLAAAALGAAVLAYTVWLFHSPRPPDNWGTDATSYAISQAFAWGLPVLTSGMAAMAGLAQLMRSGLAPLGWAAYPLAVTVVFLLGAVVMVSSIDWLL